MPVTVSIKNAPDDIVRRLKRRAQKHHRSLQGEMLAILEDAVSSPRTLSPKEILEEVQKLGLKTPSESVSIVRSDRDGR